MKGHAPERVLWMETQRAWDSPWWRAVGIGGSAAIASPVLWRLFQHCLWGVRWGGNRMSDPEFAFSLAFTLLMACAVFLLVYFLRMSTEVSPAGVRVVFTPPGFTVRTVGIGGIRRISVVEYRPIVDYGGWGIRWGLRGRALSLWGKTGIELTLAGGKRLLIGSQRPGQLRDALSRAMKRKGG